MVTRAAVRHAVPDDLVDAVGNHRVGQELEVGDLFSLPIAISFGVPRAGEAVNASERFGAHDRAIAQRGGRSRNSRKMWIEQERLGFRHVDCRIAGQEIGRRAVALHAREGALIVTELRKRGIELSNHHPGQELPIVVANIKLAIEIVTKWLEAIALFAHELVPKSGTPQAARIDFQGVTEQAGRRPLECGSKRRQHDLTVGEERLAIEMIDDEQIAIKRLLPGRLEVLGGAPVKRLGRVIARDARPAKGPATSEREVTAQADAIRIPFCVRDESRPFGAEPTWNEQRIKPRNPARPKPGELDAAEPHSLDPVELRLDVGLAKWPRQPPPADIRLAAAAKEPACWPIILRERHRRLLPTNSYVKPFGVN